MCVVCVCAHECVSTLCVSTGMCVYLCECTDMCVYLCVCVYMFVQCSSYRLNFSLMPKKACSGRFV